MLNSVEANGDVYLKSQLEEGIITKKKRKLVKVVNGDDELAVSIFSIEL
jgi:hypothetical protein